MEKIAFRAIIALSILGIALGLPMMYLGIHASGVIEQNLAQQLREVENRRKQCLSTASTDSDQLSCAISAANERAIFYDHETGAARTLWLGFTYAVIAPLMLFGLFFPLRWIFTGRWRSLQGSETTVVK